MTTGTVFDIKRYAIHDGPGIRTAIFFKGCPLSCWWCHNPEGQAIQPQLIFRSNRCKASKACLEVCPKGAITWLDGSITDWELCDDCGKCAEVCYAGAREMVGREISVNQLMNEIQRDLPFYEQSGGGVTFTGGEPLLQREFLMACLQACKLEGLHTAVDTSGYASWEGLTAIFPMVDLFLYDLKLMNDSKHQEYTSVSNALILSNLKKLTQAKARIIVRIPLIPGMNDDEENLKRAGSFLANLECLEGIELMPYHEIGLAKYKGLGMKYKMGGIKPPSRDQIEQAEETLACYHLPIIKQFIKRNL